MPGTHGVTPRYGARGAALGLLAASQFLVVLNTSIVNVALPAISDDLALSSSGPAWIVNAYLVAFGALLLAGGRLADLYGRRRTLVTGLVLFTTGSLLAVVASGAGLLIAARAVQGVGAATLSPAALAITLALYPSGPERARALGVWGAVSAAGGAAGVLLGGTLTEALGWWSVFAVSVPVGLLALVAAPLLVPADGLGRGGRLDLPGTVTATFGLLALVYGLSGAGRNGWASSQTLVPLLAGAALLAAFVLIERQVADPLVPPGLLRTASVGKGNLIMLLLGMVWVGTFFFLPLYQQRVLGYSPLAAGLTQLPLALALMAAPVVAGRVGGTLVPGLLVLAAGLTWLARVPLDGTFVRDLLGPSLLIGSGLGLAFVPLTALGVTGVSVGRAGVASGLINTTRQVGGALGLALFTAVAALATAGDTPGALANRLPLRLPRGCIRHGARRRAHRHLERSRAAGHHLMKGILP
ncbi:MFS transporter [Streptomyces sp. V1I1]|uniref:MFS transporter n=1 Tax=Streptomyces sp. V1I1 TaxID=3042272 RepID=UPI0027812C32|nr:MFS transporter [Streptomyces sp. V1I1]MDQ0945951.1 EmrB/QacA subfamily drug resistance transporter [Streptomyces sp. V1I1]